MYKFKLIIEYDGTKFSGFQKQQNSPSVQETLENSIKTIFNQDINVFCAGRTDSGVHATNQVVHFETMNDFDANKLQKAINFYLKRAPVSVKKCENLGTNSKFHARFSAQERWYEYKILQRPNHPTFQSNLYWWIPIPLNLKAMEKAAKYLIGTFDFSSFRATGCQSKSAIRTINEISICKNQDIITITVKAPSFLYHQVRNIVGTLYYIGIGKWQPEYIKDILQAKDRKKAGITAPPFGLYFSNVIY